MLALGLVISVVAWNVSDERLTGETEVKFQHQVAHAAATLDRRIQDNVNLLIGLKGLFAASNQVDRDEFRRYLSGFNVPQRYSGVRLVAFARYFTQAERAAFENVVRRDTSLAPRGYPGFAIKPPGERDDYLVVTYIEPLTGNEGAFGFDVYSENQRRPAVERARDSGEVTASEPIWLAADPQRQVSLALRMPIYRFGMPTASLEQRRAAPPFSAWCLPRSA